nr:endo-beta-1,6-glucanase {N-terminal} {EC 3.2.1.75} [Trichoderma harzianum, CECT 2413, Peptide Partial, 15 aa] [Trichoderma harzianum]
FEPALASGKTIKRGV